MQSDMKVKLVNHTGTDDFICSVARVSFDKFDAQVDTTRNQRLLNYLAKHKHWTPFAHTMITLQVRAPVPIRTQCFKHKQGFVENEESRRYINSTPTYYVPEFREATENKKQGSGDTHERNSDLQREYKKFISLAIEAYEEMIKHGVAEEQARFFLPQGVNVNWVWSGSLAAFARFCKQRMDPHAQKEIQELATEVSKVIEPLFPMAWKALMNNGGLSDDNNNI